MDSQQRTQTSKKIYERIYWRDNLGFKLTFDYYYMLMKQDESNRREEMLLRYQEECWADIGDLY